MRVGFTLVLTLAVVLASCAPATEDFDPQDPAALAAIDSLIQTAIDGAREADADGALTMAEGASDLSFITGDILLSGFEDIRATFVDTYAGVQRQDQTILEKHVRLLTPDVAVVTAVSEGTYTDMAGWTSEPVGMGHTIVFVRGADGWRAHHVHQSHVR